MIVTSEIINVISVLSSWVHSIRFMKLLALLNHLRTRNRLFMNYISYSALYPRQQPWFNCDIHQEIHFKPCTNHFTRYTHPLTLLQPQTHTKRILLQEVGNISHGTPIPDSCNYDIIMTSVISPCPWGPPAAVTAPSQGSCCWPAGLWSPSAHSVQSQHHRESEGTCIGDEGTTPGLVGCPVEEEEGGDKEEGGHREERGKKMW